ncbi:hypothetical protein KM043_011083 [Ampulex compressa]|nr:hypothetical protein KM043_011083 [Ampulex compressa]
MAAEVDERSVNGNCRFAFSEVVDTATRVIFWTIACVQKQVKIPSKLGSVVESHSSCQSDIPSFLLLPVVTHSSFVPLSRIRFRIGHATADIRLSKHQQVSVDFVNMVFTAFSYLALAGAVWIFLRLVQACFWLPRHLKKQNDVQRMLQDKVESYEKYILECEEKEKSMEGNQETENDKATEDNITKSQEWKERRECLEMLKRELNRVRDGGDPYDWDHLLDEELEKNGDFMEIDEEDEERCIDKVQLDAKPKERGKQGINLEPKKHQ